VLPATTTIRDSGIGMRVVVLRLGACTAALAAVGDEQRERHAPFAGPGCFVSSIDD
jgi:hypothetical protein